MHQFGLDNSHFLFRNDHFAVVQKPAGWLTTPARVESDPRPCLGRTLQAHLQQQIYPVHRLDFEVSGLTLWALSKDAHRDAQRWFEKRLVEKLYHARTICPPGFLSADWLAWRLWKSRLVRGKRRTFQAAHGDEALTEVCLLKVDGANLLFALKPLTGRAHQLRFEMANHGLPIMGDVLYGGKSVAKPDWIALRAVSLGFAQIPLPDRFGLPERIEAAGLADADIDSEFTEPM